MLKIFAARFSRRSLLLFFPILLALAGSSFGVPSAFAFGAVTQSECTAQGGACQNAFCNLSTQIDVGPCVTPGLPNGQECCKAQGAGGACPGGTCRSGSCQAGESAFGACSFADICCMPGGAVPPLGGGTQPTTVVCNGVIKAGVCFPTNTGLSSQSVLTLLMRLMNWLLGILGFIAIIAFVISGLQYLISAGDEDMIETAKRNMKYSIVGVIVALSGFVIIRAIDQALSGGMFF